MKKVIKHILLFIIFFVVNNITSQEIQYSTLNLSELFVVNNYGKEVSFFCSKKELVLNFGQPLSITQIQDADMLDYEIIEEYKYNGVTFILETRPSEVISISFEITNSNYGIKYRKNTIKIGDSIEDIEQMNIFSDSFDLLASSITPDYLRLEFIEDNKTSPYFSPLFIEFTDDIEGKIIENIRIELMS